MPKAVGIEQCVGGIGWGGTSTAVPRCTTGYDLSPAFCGHICSAAAYQVPTSAETPGRTSWPALSENTKGQAQGPCRICLCMLSKQPTCQNIDRRVGEAHCRRPQGPPVGGGGRRLLEGGRGTRCLCSSMFLVLSSAAALS